MKVSFLDLKKQYSKIKPEIQEAVNRVLDSQQFILGQEVKKFEEEIQEYCEVKHAIGVSSGTDAILLALMCLGVGPEWYVITTPYTFFATAGCIDRLGATPVFIDIDPKTFNIDTSKLEKEINYLSTSNLVVMPVHLFGQMADMNEIMILAKKYNFKVVEDAAQAIGAKQIVIDYLTNGAGTIGDLGCFSFFPSKNLGGAGDGGMVVTSNDSYAETIRMLRSHGSKPKYYHSLVGINGRLDELQAAILRVKLKYLDMWSLRRYQNAEFYELSFSLRKEDKLNGNFLLPSTYSGNFNIFNQYVIRAERRNELRDFLKLNEIGTEIYYPVPLHLQKCFEYLGYKEGDFPESEKAAKETLALPIFPELEDEQMIYVTEKILEFYK